MKQRYLITAFTALVAAKLQADFSPTCSVQMMSCLNTGMLNAGCKLSDLKCACINQNAIKGTMLPCTESACSSKERAHFLNLKTNDHCDDFGAFINAASGRASAAAFHGKSLEMDHVPMQVAAYHADEPSFTGTIIVVPNDPTTPCDPYPPRSTMTSTVTTETLSHTTPLPSDLPPANATGPTPTPSLPVFTDAAGSVKVGGVAVGLMALGVML